jgi:PAS domain S-box-containing protein
MTDGSRILIVEDEALIADEINDRLGRLGFTVVGRFDSAEAAISAAETTRPDLVLMDIRLRGGMDGVAAACYLREHLDIPVIYLTAHSDPATLIRARDSAPFGYILKPFHERDLLVTIEIAKHRHSLERRLRQSEMRYAATLASIADGVISTDAEGFVSYMNPVAETLTGWKLDDASGRAIEEVVPVISESTRGAVENPARAALLHRKVVKLTDPVLLKGRDRSEIPIDDTAAPIIDTNGNVAGAVMAFRDVREQRIAQNAVRNAEERLRQSLKMEAIGRLAGGVAHDFNNLLTIINGYSQLLLTGNSLDDATRGLIQEIHTAGERAASLTSQLLAFSRKQVLATVVLDLNLLVREMEKMLGRLIGENIALVVKLDPELAHVSADPNQIEQVVLNLAINARDVMPDGGVLTLGTEQVEIGLADAEATPELEPGSYSMLTISDTGSGMDETTKANLFEPFFTTKKQGKGTGLGLATVYGIIRQSNGCIYVDSEPGKGTSFSIYLPAVREPVTQHQSFSKPVAGGDETILVVEDEAGVRSLAASTLRRNGYTVLEAGSGEEAITICEQHPGEIDLLLTDVVMPGIGGRQLAEFAFLLKPGIQVLYMSGYTDDTVLRHGVLRAEPAFLQKPFALDAMLHKVRELLDRLS